MMNSASHETRKPPDSLATLILDEPRDQSTEVLKFEANRSSGYPTPRGEFFGHFIQYPTSVDPPRQDEKRPIDVLRLSFAVGQAQQFKHDLKPDFRPVRSPSAVVFNNWRKEIVMSKGCQRLDWSISDENDVLLFISWVNDLAQAAGQSLVANVPDALVKLLSSTPAIFHLRSPGGPGSQPRHSNSEIVFFYCPTASNDKRHFEYYYDAFTSTLRPGTIQVSGSAGPHAGSIHLGSAGLNCGSSWSSDPVFHRNENADVFVAFLHWHTEFARKQWYDDYSRMSYDDLGWRVNGLRGMASLGVESYCLDLSQNDKETMSLWENLGFPKGGVERQVLEHSEWEDKLLEHLDHLLGVRSDHDTGE